MGATDKTSALQEMLELQSKYNISIKDYIEAYNSGGEVTNKPSMQSILILNDIEFLSGKYSSYKSLINIPSYLINHSYYYEFSTTGDGTKYIDRNIDTLVNQGNKLGLQYVTTDNLTVTFKSGYTMDRTPFKWYPQTNSTNIKNTTASKGATSVNRLFTSANTQSPYPAGHVYIYLNTTFNFLPSMKI